MKFAVVTFPYSMDTDAGTAAGPKALLQTGLADWLREQGHAVAGPFHVQLASDERGSLWSWRRPKDAEDRQIHAAGEAAQPRSIVSSTT
jgi:hypothetical protein